MPLRRQHKVLRPPRAVSHYDKLARPMRRSRFALFAIECIGEIEDLQVRHIGIINQPLAVFFYSIIKCSLIPIPTWRLQEIVSEAWPPFPTGAWQYLDHGVSCERTSTGHQPVGWIWLAPVRESLRGLTFWVRKRHITMFRRGEVTPLFWTQHKK